MTAQLMPWAISRETDATNLPLSGGKVYTYQAGTTTPYPTWADADQTIPNANPVILDAGGFHPIFLDPAQAYDIEIQDSTGAQVVPVFHNIRLSQASSSVTNTLGIFANYDALRNQVGTAYAVAIVLGRTSAGDGGYGIFWKMATSPWVDDDGSVLVNGANVYARQTDYLDPLWFGAVYSLAANQVAAISHAAIASAARAAPVVVSGSLFLQSGFGFPSGAAVKFVLPGKLISNVAVSVTFADGAQLIDAATGCFAGEVQPSFAGPIREVRSSWFANVSGDRVAAKWLGCASTLTRAVLDSAITGLTTLTASALYDIDVEGGSLAFQNTSGGALNLARVIYDGRAKWIGGPVSSTYLATASAGSPVRPEWFGAFGSGSTDDFYALANASVFGAVKFHAGAVYLCMLGNVPASRIECDGNAPAELRFSAGRVLAATNLRISGIIVSGDANCVQAATLFARDCTFPSGYVASVSADIDGCTFTGDSRTPVSAGKPALYNPHLPLIVSSESLLTDSAGKIYGAYGKAEFNAEYNLRTINAQGTGFSARVRNFFETPTLICFANGTMGYWYRSKTDVNGLWVYNSSVSIATTGGSQKSILYMNYNAGNWYAATQSNDGSNWHYEIFYAADPSGTWAPCTGDGSHNSGEYPYGWNNCVRNSLTGDIYISYGMDTLAPSPYVSSAIVKVTGTSAVDQDAGYGREYAKIIGMDEVNDYLYINSFRMSGGAHTDGIISRKKMSTNVEVSYAYGTDVNCMGMLTGGDCWLLGLAGGSLALGYGFLGSFAPTITAILNPNMGNIATMVNAQYSITAGSDAGKIGVSQSTPQARIFSNRLSGMEGATYNATAFGFTASYYLASTREVLVGGSGGSVYSSRA